MSQGNTTNDNLMPAHVRIINEVCETDPAGMGMATVTFIIEVMYKNEIENIANVSALIEGMAANITPQGPGTQDPGSSPGTFIRRYSASVSGVGCDPMQSTTHTITAYATIMAALNESSSIQVTCPSCPSPIPPFPPGDCGDTNGGE